MIMLILMFITFLILVMIPLFGVMTKALDLMVGSATGAAAPGTTLTMKNGSLTLDEKGGKQPFVVGLLCSTTARTRESYINYKVDEEGSKTEDYRRIYMSQINDAYPDVNGLGFFPIMKQQKKGDIIDCRVVDVGTTILGTVGILISYGGPPKMIDAAKVKKIWGIDITAATPADATTAWAKTGVDDIASGTLNDFPKKMDIIGGYVIPEDAQVGGIRTQQAFELGVQPGLCPGIGFLKIGNRYIVLATIDNYTLLENECVVIAANEIEAGYYAVPS